MDILVVAGHTLAISVYFFLAAGYLRGQGAPAGASYRLMGTTNLAAAGFLFPLWLGAWATGRLTLVVSPAFWAYLLAVVGLTILARHLHFLALTRCDLSVITPFAGLTPPATILVGILLLDEYPSFAGAGVILIVSLSIYLIHYQPTRGGPLLRIIQPFLAMFSNRYVFYGFLSALPPAFGIAFLKASVRQGDPLTYALAFCVAMGGGALLLQASQRRRARSEAAEVVQPPWRLVLICGLLMAVASYLLSVATQHYIVPYLTAMSRSSIAIQVILAALFLGERRHFRRRLLASLLILAAFVVLGFDGA